MHHILSSQITMGEYARNVWVCKPAEGVTIADMQDPTYWVHVAKQMRVGDHIEAMAFDGSWYVEFIVRSRGDLEVVVGEIRSIEFKPVAPRNESEYEIKFCGPIVKWRVTRLSDKVAVKEGLTKDEAQAWLGKSPLEAAA